MTVIPVPIYPNDPGVLLSPHPLRWRKLPLAVRKSIVQNQARVAHIREEIALAAPVQWMPPIRIFSTAWATPEAAILGRCTVATIEGKNLPCVQLPASTIIFSDDQVLRGILVHEFSHAFNLLTRCIDHVDAGTPDSPLVLSEVDDCEMHVDLRDWFSDADAAAFVSWNDPRCDELTERTGLEWIAAGLPTEDVRGHKVQRDSMSYPLHVAERIRHLRCNKSRPPSS